MLRPTIIISALALSLSACSDTGDVAPPQDLPDADLNGGDIDHNPAQDVEDITDTESPPPGPPRLDFSPHQINFKPRELDDTDIARVTIRNLGESPLLVSDVQLQQFGAPHTPDFSPGEVWPELPLFIEPSTYRDFELLYQPTTYGAHQGLLTFFSDDPQNLQVPIRIETTSAYPDIELPARQNLGTVFPQESATTRIEVYNRGAAPLHIDHIDLHPAPSAPHGVLSFEVLGQGPPYILRQDHFIYVDITASPTDDQRVEAELLLQTNDPAQEEATVELLLNGPSPCLRTSGDIDFGEVRTGQSATETLTILNCSASHPLNISHIELTDDAGQIFSFVDPPNPPIAISPRQTKQLQLRAEMTAPDMVVGSLKLTSDDPHIPTLTLSLRLRPPKDD